MDTEQVGDMADKASDLAGQAGDRLSDAAKSAREMAGNVGEKAYAAGTQAAQYAEKTVQEQPLLSLIGIAAIGYAIGFLIHSAASPFAPRPARSRYLNW
jgi:ElaB/YqjD/DUF883 family membrane-anchored ribosome-binding protein